VIDPAARRRVEGLHMETDYSPFDGTDLRGRVDTVVSAGSVLLQGGAWSGAEPTGRFIRRRRLQAA